MNDPVCWEYRCEVNIATESENNAAVFTDALCTVNKTKSSNYQSNDHEGTLMLGDKRHCNYIYIFFRSVC